MKRAMYIVNNKKDTELLEDKFSESFDITILDSYRDIERHQEQKQEKVDVILFNATGINSDELKIIVNIAGLPQFKNTTFIAIMKSPQPKMEELLLRCNIEDVVYESMTAETVRIRTEKAMKMRYLGHDVNDTYAGVIKTILEKWGLENKEHLIEIKKVTKILLTCLKKKRPDCLTDSDIEMISRASILHDIGKIMIPANVLMKPGKLTDVEFETVKNHTIYGCELLLYAKDKDSRFYKYCYEICRYHHERWDGSGYPDKLEGDDIPLWAQVVGIVDVYESLISKKVYKDAIPKETAIELIISGKCGSFSPELIDCIKQCKNDILTA